MRAMESGYGRHMELARESLSRMILFFSRHLETSLLLEVEDGHHFFENNTIRKLQIKEEKSQQESSDIMMYECPQPGCKQAFDTLN